MTRHRNRPGRLTVADAALRYANRGIPVFPCRRNLKVPATGHGFKDATTDTGLLGAWWDQWPDANIATPTGKPSRRVVLDVDGDDGRESLQRLIREHGPLPPTVEVATPRGGSHYWFRWPGQPVGCSAGKLGKGIDVRGDGGYSLLPPSMVNGREYRTVTRGALADPPKWMLTGVASTTGRRTPSGTWLQLVRDGADAGVRDTELTRFVGHLLSRDVDALLVLEIAHAVNKTRFRPPLDTAEVDQVVESIAGRELRKRTGAS